MSEANQSAAEIGRHAAEAAIGTAQDGARQIGASVREAALGLVTEQKTRLADTVHGFAEVLRRTAESQGENTPVVAQAADQAATQLERLSDTLRQRELGDLFSEIEGLGRRQPALFLAGAVAAGFVVTRIFSAPGRPRLPAPSATDGEGAWQPGSQPAAAPHTDAAWGRS